MISAPRMPAMATSTSMFPPFLRRAAAAWPKFESLTIERARRHAQPIHMQEIAPTPLLLASANAAPVSLNYAAWAGLARHGLVESTPLFDEFGPAIVITLTENGKAALVAAAANAN